MENMNEIDNVITLQDEDGNDIEFEFLDLIVIEGVNYVVALPLDEDENDEVAIFRYEDEDSIVGESDPDVLAEVFEIFKERNGELFDFVD